jgi:hypothetical protein
VQQQQQLGVQCFCGQQQQFKPEVDGSSNVSNSILQQQQRM